MPCGNLHTFLDYLLSESTRKASVHSISVAFGSTTVVLNGPRCDDGCDQSVAFRLTREMVRTLPEEETLALRNRLGELGLEPQMEQVHAALQLPR